MTNNSTDKPLPAPPPKIPLNQRPLSDPEAEYELKRAEADELEEEIEVRKDIIKKLIEIKEAVRERKRKRKFNEQDEDVKVDVMGKPEDLLNVERIAERW